MVIIVLSKYISGISEARFKFKHSCFYQRDLGYNVVYNDRQLPVRGRGQGSGRKKALSSGGLLVIAGVTKKILQNDLFFNHHFAHVDQAISHTAQCCIDTAFGKIGDFFKAQIGIMT
jgi:hypothetical protein